MQHAWLDFSQLTFWIVWFIALWILNLAPSYQWHRKFRVILNLSVLYILLNFEALSYLISGLVIFHFILKLLYIKSTKQLDDLTQSSAFIRGICYIPLPYYHAAIILVLIDLFSIHKGIFTLHHETMNVILGAIGFSYVMLRAIDLMYHVSQHKVKTSLFDLMNYMLPFHMLTAGPIQSFQNYQQAETKLKADWHQQYQSNQEIFYHHAHLQRYLTGMERMVWGFFKKYVIAASIHTLFLNQFQHEGWLFFLEIQMFYLWLYLDFSAYSDIAVGIGICLNIQTPENFNQPLSTRNLTTFWEHWHISLSQWIKVRLYLPIQMAVTRKTRNAYPLWSASFSFTCAFILCGVWHELSWRFFLWGALHALGLSLCNIYRTWLTRKFGRKWVRQVYMKNPYIKMMAQCLTFEFVALSLLFAFYPT